MSAHTPHQHGQPQPGPQPLPGVDAIIAVGSGKGGVGKTTLSVNLAVALVKMGYKVGLLDADVYGPNVPLMLGTNDQPRMVGDNRIEPLQAFGLKVISVGFLNPGDKPIIWRGPMLHQIVRQFLWSHWTERRPANLFLTGVSREGKVTHSEYRISVSRGDTPLLQVRFVRDRAGYQGKVVPRDDGGYAACTMERVQSENPFGQDPETKITVLPRDAGVPPTKYWLRFKGWNDTLITYF